MYSFQTGVSLQGMLANWFKVSETSNFHRSIHLQAVSTTLASPRVFTFQYCQFAVLPTTHLVIQAVMYELVVVYNFTLHIMKHITPNISLKSFPQLIMCFGKVENI